ncbi:PaaI family thioesterase [Salinifilum aidingensis]
MSGERRRHEAVRVLGEALRELNTAAVSTEVTEAELRAVAEDVREHTARLRARTRDPGQRGSAEDGERPRAFNPAVGPGNPFAPPLRVEIVDGRAVGRCTLGPMHEGPPGYAHGGVSALLLDQVLGHAHAARGRPGMTVQLSLRYRRPVPLREPLVLTGEVEEDEGGRWTRSTATIATEADPGTVAVRAEGRFVVPSAEQNRRLFGADRDPRRGRAGR